MTIANLVDALRVWAAFAAFFIVIPWWLTEDKRSPLALCATFIRTFLFAEITSLLLGYIRVCLPGSVGIAWLLYVLVSLWFLNRLNTISERSWWRWKWTTLLALAEVGTEPLQLARRRPVTEAETNPWRRYLWTAIALVLLSSVHALQNASFVTGDSYARSLSLQVLTLGQSWTPDPSVAFLAPVAFLSGMDGATVVRFSNPFLAMILAVSSGFAAYRLSRSKFTAITAAGIVLFASLSPSVGGELDASAIALIFALMAVSLLTRSLPDSAWAMALTLLIGAKPGHLAIVVCLVMAGALLLRVVPRVVSFVPGPLVAGALLPILFVKDSHDLRAHGPHEYESAARTISEIARTLPRNSWLAVSPVQELPFIYGRGWHSELSEFVQAYTEAQTSQPDFKFPFPVRTVFVFVEKQPLATSEDAGGPLRAELLEPALVPYQSTLDRAALEYQAGQVMTAYAASHRNSSVFFEDETLVVYRIDQ